MLFGVFARSHKATEASHGAPQAHAGFARVDCFVVRLRSLLAKTLNKTLRSLLAKDIEQNATFVLYKDIESIVSNFTIEGVAMVGERVATLQKILQKIIA